MKIPKENNEVLILHKGQSDYSQALKKIHENSSKNPQKACFFKEIWRVHKRKIDKMPRKPLSNLTNLPRKVFLDENKPNFEVLGFLNRQSQDLMFFRCFDEKDLKIPEEFAKKTISHTLDNDVSTDEEQVKSAIRNLKNSMKETIEKKKKEGKTTEIQANKPKVLLIR